MTDHWPRQTGSCCRDSGILNDEEFRSKTAWALTPTWPGTLIPGLKRNGGVVSILRVYVSMYQLESVIIKPDVVGTLR